MVQSGALIEYESGSGSFLLPESLPSAQLNMPISLSGSQTFPLNRLTLHAHAENPPVGQTSSFHHSCPPVQAPVAPLI